MVILTYIGLSQALFAALVIFTKKGRRLSDKYLGFWMLAIALELFLMILKQNVKMPYIPVVPFLFGPLIYLYVLALLTGQRIPQKLDFTHFIPAVVVLIVSLAFFKNPIFDVAIPLSKKSYYVLRFFYSFAFTGTLLFYAYRVIRTIIKHDRNIKNRFSNTSDNLTLNWIKIITGWFALVFFVMNIYGMVFNIRTNFFDEIDDQSLIIGYIYIVGLTVTVFMYSFFGLRQPAIFANVNSGALLYELKKYQALKKNKSNLSDFDVQQYTTKLNEYMVIERPYLNSDLNIFDLAKKIGMSRNQLTLLLNDKIKKNFYNYVNEYRVDEVKRRLENRDHLKYNIISIAMDSGFNSKSTFHKFFKQITGQTPSEFIADLEQNSDNS